MSDPTQTEIQTKGLGFALRMIGQATSIPEQNQTVLLAAIYEMQITLSAALNDEDGMIADPAFMHDLRQVVLRQQERRRQITEQNNCVFAAPPL